MKLYRYVPIWSRASKGLVLYRCFEVLGLGFTVQSKDHFSVAPEPGVYLQLHSQFLELFTEQAPELRFPCEPTIEAAVAAFDSCFRGE
jgi:hypothetical protein